MILRRMGGGRPFHRILVDRNGDRYGRLRGEAVAIFLFKFKKSGGHLNRRAVQLTPTQEGVGD